MFKKVGIISYTLLFISFIFIVNYFSIDVNGVVESDIYQNIFSVGKSGVAIGYRAFLAVLSGLN